MSHEEIRRKLVALEGWKFTPQGIQKRYEMGNFLSAMNLVERVADLAEPANHHCFFRLLPTLTLILIAGRFAFTQTSSPDPAQIRRQLQDSIARAPWSSGHGYQLEGQFTFKGTGEEIDYNASYLRHSTRWLATFVNTDSSKNVSCGLDGRPWVSSPETMTDIRLEQLPFCAQYDFPILNRDLMRILEEGPRDPLYSVAREGKDLYVRGTLWNGLQATFTFNTVDFFPRKAAILARSNPPPAWLFPILEPSGISTLIRCPNHPSDQFELWFSDPVGGSGYRYPQRTDYADPSGVVGTFILGNIRTVSEAETFAGKPAHPVWAEKLYFQSQSGLHHPLLTLSESELSSFRSRLANPPWKGWRQTNALVAIWGIVASWTGFLFPSPPSLTALTTTLGVVLLAFVFLLRRRRQIAQRVSLKLQLTVFALWSFVLLSGLAAMQTHSPLGKSLTALHLAIRYSATGNSIYGWHSRRLLRNLEKAAPSASSTDLARACLTGSLAYDLISPALRREEQKQIELSLFLSAKPVYGAMQGWRANTGAEAAFAAALGVTGLAISFEPYVNSARKGIDKTLREQLVGGLHREGPAAGCLLFNDLVNLFYAFKRAGIEDYFKSPAFLEYLSATEQLFSPAGTLPLFSETGLDHAVPAIQLLLKASNHVPVELGRRGVALYDRYWMHGHFSPAGWRGAVHGMLDRHVAFYNDPYMILQYERALAAAPLPAESIILGNGQAVILRSGAEPTSAYLALNARKVAANLDSRDILSFDLYSGGSMLLHGAGSPGRKSPAFIASAQTAASNSISFNEASQSALVSGGVGVALLNQPLLDYVRILADKTYEHGQVLRDAIMVRPEKDRLPYFLLIDEIHTNDPATRVHWYLHGRGKLSTGIEQLSRWTCAPFASPALPSPNLITAVYPIGLTADRRSISGKIYTQNRLLEQASETLIMEWEGSKRFCTVLYPYRAGQTAPTIESVSSSDSGIIGGTDWISLSDPSTRRTTGPLKHVSECIVLRTKGSRFPALLMVAGTEFQFAEHSFLSSKPLTISFDGLRGGLINLRPNTQVEMRSPEIRSGDRFLLDDTPISPVADGMLSFLLAQTGEHRFRRVPEI